MLVLDDRRDVINTIIVRFGITLHYVYSHDPLYSSTMWP